LFRQGVAGGAAVLDGQTGNYRLAPFARVKMEGAMRLLPVTARAVDNDSLSRFPVRRDGDRFPQTVEIAISVSRVGARCEFDDIAVGGGVDSRLYGGESPRAVGLQDVLRSVCRCNERQQA